MAVGELHSLWGDAVRRGMSGEGFTALEQRGVIVLAFAPVYKPSSPICHRPQNSHLCPHLAAGGTITTTVNSREPTEQALKVLPTLSIQWTERAATAWQGSVRLLMVAKAGRCKVNHWGNHHQSISADILLVAQCGTKGPVSIRRGRLECVPVSVSDQTQRHMSCGL